jgi:hypothetical protein
VGPPPALCWVYGVPRSGCVGLVVGALHLFIVRGDGNDVTNIGFSEKRPEKLFRDFQGAAGAPFVLPKGVLTLSTFMSAFSVRHRVCLSGVGVVLIADPQCTLGRVRPSR